MNRAIILAAALAATTPAAAQVLPEDQVSCASSNQILTELIADYGEIPAFYGNTTTLEGDPVSIAILANPSNGTWTMVVNSGDIACMNIFGTGGQKFTDRGM